MARTLNPVDVAAWLVGKRFEARVTTYVVEVVSEYFVVFSATPRTGKVMLPIPLVVEWLQAYEDGHLRADMDPRAMRNVVTTNSVWATQLHSFETHLAAVVVGWSGA